MIFTNIKMKRIKNLEPDILEALALNHKLILAGGAVRDALFGNEIQDYDLFLESGADVEQVKGFFIDKGYSNTFKCPEGKLFTYVKRKDGGETQVGKCDPSEHIKVQIIVKRYYYDTLDLINSFDFSVTYFGMRFEHNTLKVYTDHRAIEDVRKKRINLVNLEYPTSTINRLHKYRARGYYCGFVIKDIVKRVAEMGDSYDPKSDTLYID